MRRRAAFVGAVGMAAAMLLADSTLFACDQASYDISWGVLGGWTSVIWPSNFVVLGDTNYVETADHGTTFFLERVPGTSWSRLAEPVPAGTMLVVPGTAQIVTVGDYADDAPPSTPAIVDAEIDRTPEGGCLPSRRPICGGLVTLLVAIEPATDDHTSAASMTFAVYGGHTADEAGTGSRRIRLLPTGFVDVDGTTLVDAWGRDSDEDVRFIAIAAVDQAGNVGARSAPARLR